VNNHYIFIFGGYDGVQRLASIEKYEPDMDTWTVLDVSLRFPLSNCACFSPKWNQILVLGGGFSNGFSFQVECLDISRSSWKSFSKMSEGRDLRNKIAYFENQAYCIGGYNSKAEKLDLNTEEWIQLPNYIINDNLDAWSSALIYSLEPIQDNKNNKISF
jgi:N-acetylneuraminic acid mutarotase